MIETSAPLLLLAFGVFLHLQQQRRTKLAHLAWVVSATRLRRDNAELRGRIEEVEHLTDVADSISSGAGSIALKLKMSEQKKSAIRTCAIEASREDFLIRSRLVEGAPNYAAAREALYWLAKKASN